MKAVLTLVFAETRRHRVRVLLTSLATAASVCLIIWVVGGYDALVGRSDAVAEQLLAPYDVILGTQEASGQYPSHRLLARGIDPQLVQQLRADRDIESFEPVMVVRTKMLDLKGRGRGPGGTMLIGTDATQSPYEMDGGDWFQADSARPMEGVLSSAIARRYKLKPGDEFLVHALGGEYRMKLAGIVNQPSTSRSFGGLYTSTAIAEKIAGQPARINRVHIELKDGVAAADFAQRWLRRFDDANPPVQLTGLDDLAAEFSEGRSLAILEQQRFYATGVAILAATFIIFTTLSMGVSERIRQFAVLRAVGMTRGQVASVVFGEGVLLALVGWAFGLVAGWGLLQLNPQMEAGLFDGTVSLSLRAVLISIACVVVGTGAAAILPAWSATRMKPLDIIPSGAKPSRAMLPALGVIVGLVLISINPLLVYGVSVSAHFRYAGYMLIGCTSMAVGFVLVTPLVVVLVERVLGPPLAAVMRLNRHLVSQQLSNNLWRSVGTVICLTVGLGLFVSIQVWGHSMVVPFLPGGHLPDVVVSFMPSGLPEEEIEAVGQVDGIVSKRCVPLAIEQAKLTSEMLQSEGLTRPRQKAVYLFMGEQDNVLFIGMAPGRAIGGENPPIGMTFIEGDRQTAINKLAQGRYCLVPDHFHVETGLGVGDQFNVIPPNAPDTTLTWEIAGVVSIPGWHWVTKMSDMRPGSPKTLSAVFISYDNARRDFALDRVNHFWANTEPGTDVKRLEKSMGAIAARNANVRFQLPAVGEIATAKPYASVTDVRQVERIVRWRTKSVLWMMSKFPLIVLAITTLAVVNTIMASIRARRWEFGVLRALGLTTGGLTRLVFAESMLVGLVACALSLAFGTMAAWCATGICTYIFYFGGLQPPLVIPWLMLLLGFVGTLGLCTLAAIGPAISTARTEPAKLLQVGRTTM